MIPYFEQPSISIGPLTIYAFGVLTVLGVIVGAKIAARAASRYSSLPIEPLERAIPWAVAGGIMGGHLLHVFGYHPELLAREGWLVIFKIWDGQSSMGGLLGGVFGFLISFRKQNVGFLPYLDALALGTAPGWAIARIGCFAAHDHPGTLTNFPLAVAFPGGARHDLGLYDAIVLAMIAVALHVLARKQRSRGTLIGVMAIGYGISRFFLDFLRATDVPLADGRILGLTPAQYVSLALIAIGTAFLIRAIPIRSRDDASEAHFRSPTPSSSSSPR